MVAERREVKQILLELLSSNGNSLFVRKASHYLHDGDQLPFSALMRRAQQQSEILLGYYKNDSLIPLINPKNKDEVLEWTHNDHLIVLARETGPPASSFKN